MAVKHAVLEMWEELYYLRVGSEVHEIELPDRIEQFLPLFEQWNVTTIWVMPRCGFSQAVTWEYIGHYDHSRYNVFPDRRMEHAKLKRPTFLRLRRERQKGERLQPEYYLAFPEWEDWLDSGKSWSCPDARTLLDTVSYVEMVQGTPAWSPQNMGKNHLRRIHERRGWKIEETILTDYLKGAINRSVQRPTWVRDGGLTEEQKGMKWVIGADKNGQYVGGTRNLTLGNGPYMRVGPERFDGKVAGLWYVEVVSVRESLFNSYDLFCPWVAPKQWLSTDLLVASRDAGIKFMILEGLVWEQSGKYMDQWGKETWECRASYNDASRFPNEVARLNAAGTAKQVGNSLIGLLAKPQSVTGRGMVYRPDWNVLIIHKAIANLMYSLKTRQTKYGVLPVLLARGDTQWIVSDTEEVPTLFDHEKEQRGWKAIGKPIPMSEEIRGMFAEEEGNGVKANEGKAAKIAEYLEQKAKEQ